MATLLASIKGTRKMNLRPTQFGQLVLAVGGLLASQVGAVESASRVDAGREATISEIRQLCQTLAKEHFNSDARVRARAFLLLTETRLWRDNTGNFSTTAQYIGHDTLTDGIHVELMKSNGSKVKVPMKQLSSGDQRVVHELADSLFRLSEDALTLRNDLSRKLTAARRAEPRSSRAAVASALNGWASVPWSFNGTQPLGFGAYPGGIVAPLPYYSSYGFPYGYSTAYYGYSIPNYGYGYSPWNNYGYRVGRYGNPGFSPRSSYGGGYGYSSHPYRSGAAVHHDAAPAASRVRRSPFTGGNIYGR